jgi:hypothetical protein
MEHRSLLALIVFLLFNINVFSQESYLNVPAGGSVGKDTLFFQEQTDIIHHQLQSGTTLTKGLGHGWEVGINLFNVTLNLEDHKHIMELSKEETASNPRLLMNIKKSFSFTDKLGMAIGSRAGFNIGDWDYERFAHFSYMNFNYDVSEDNTFTIGAFTSDKDYAGRDLPFGYMAAFKASIKKNKLLFQADMISGKSNISYAATGLVYLFERWSLASALLIPLNPVNYLGFTVQLSTR